MNYLDMELVNQLVYYYGESWGAAQPVAVVKRPEQVMEDVSASHRSINNYSYG